MKCAVRLGGQVIRHHPKARAVGQKLHCVNHTANFARRREKIDRGQIGNSAPLAGLTMRIFAAGRLVVTLIVTASEVVFSPALSVATAVRL